jgi:ubiquinone/menaquinone biosynthesis C-methylase UbiE
MKKIKTSWGKEAEWYSVHLEDDGTYHRKVILPNALRLVEPKKGQKILEIGCGEGFFARALAEKGSEVVACDISPELIAVAQKKEGNVEYRISEAQDLSWAKNKYDVVLAVLTLQNMEKLEDVMKEVRKVLKENGRFIFILNHPVIRIPKASHWGFDKEAHIQYRRLDSYLSSRRVEMDMHPGKNEKSVTYSFHRSLQDYMKVLRSAGFCIVRIEEWISHKTSEPGPRAKAENAARKEFPLFMAIEAQIFLD